MIDGRSLVTRALRTYALILAALIVGTMAAVAYAANGKGRVIRTSNSVASRPACVSGIIGEIYVDSSVLKTTLVTCGTTTNASTFAWRPMTLGTRAQ